MDAVVGYVAPPAPLITTDIAVPLAALVLPLIVGTLSFRVTAEPLSIVIVVCVTVCVASTDTSLP